MDVDCGSSDEHDATTTTATATISTTPASGTDAWLPPPHSVPIKADVRSFDFEALGREAQFDVVLMDPPWQLATNTPSRGVCRSTSITRCHSLTLSHSLSLSL
jgi:hypothetical protein